MPTAVLSVLVDYTVLALNALVKTGCHELAMRFYGLVTHLIASSTRIPDTLVICAVVEVDEFKNDSMMVGSSKMPGRYVVGLESREW